VRPTIDFGIDLGTTNSVVAVAEDGRVDVIKNNDNQEITPSVVQLLASGSVIVGRKAYEHYRAHGEGNAYTGVKRQMGKQDQRYPFAAAGVEKGPEDLAAELLKSLRADAEAWAGEAVRAAVITVPAAFELAQCEATQRAAARAGIEQAPLLQEPIAAGLAYGYQRDLEEGYFIVYDLGGGTFDVTLLQIRDGRLLVIDHDGHNFLGGRDWDRRLAELLLSRLETQGYEAWTASDPRSSENRGLLEAQAEEEKIRLSRLDEVDVVFDGRLADARGRPIEATVSVTRLDYEALITEDLERSIALSQELLTRQGLEAADVARIVPVGGPTLTPLLRQRLTERLSITLDTRIDPMTVVARGAAFFAAGVSVGESVSALRPVAADALQVQLSYPSVSDDTEVPVGGRLADSNQPGLSLEIRRGDGGWASGRLPTENDTFFTTVVLTPRRANVFELACFDSAGNRVALSPDRFAITQGLAAADPPLSQSISVVAYDDRGEEAVFGMLAKGTALPAVRERSFRTARELRPGQTAEALRVHVLEGEQSRPELNRHVGWLDISGAEVDRALPVGTPVDVKLRVDASRGIIASAYIPLIDLTIENVLQDKYRPSVDLDRVAEELAAELDRAREVGAGRSQDVGQIESEAQKVEREVAAARSGDRDAADRADLALKELKAAVDRLDAETETSRLAEKVVEERETTREIVREYGGAEARTRLALLETEAERALNSGDAERMRSAAEEFDDLYWRVVTEHPGFWVEQFIQLAEAAEQSSRSVDARPLLARGRQALDSQDIDTVRAVCFDLLKLLPREEQPASGLKDIGIRG
jgi:molecular chaperone DnaK